MSDTPEPAIRQRLVDTTNVSQIVGQRVYGGHAPQGVEFPYVVFTLNDADRSPRVNGGLVAASMQIASVDDDYTGSKVLAREIRKAVNEWAGVKLGRTVRRVFLESSSDEYEAPEHAEGIGTFAVVDDYRVWFREDVNSL